VKKLTATAVARRRDVVTMEVQGFGDLPGVRLRGGG